jgi:hypothetical protein
MSRKNKKISKRPSLFSPPGLNISKQSDKDSIKLSQIKDTNINSSASFRYDSPSMGIKSTQQIPINYDNFENHTFFNSAQAKTNIAFDTIINEFPFDGTKKEMEAFFDGLTGFENYVFSRFPKFKGYLHFSGTVAGEDPAGGFDPLLGTRIEVYDSSGYLFPNFSKIKNGKASIDFEQNPFSLEYHMMLPPLANSNQIIMQKRASASFGITLALSQSSDTESCNLIFSVNSGSTYLLTSGTVEKGDGTWNHVTAVYDRYGDKNLKLYNNLKLVSSSSASALFDTLSIDKVNLVIGSGSTFNVDSKMMPGGQSTFTPATTFTGSLDEIRIFHSYRRLKDQKQYARKTIYSSDDLKLYFKLNEPTGSYKPTGVVLDSSGNSLHSVISNFNINLRRSGSDYDAITYEKIYSSPILFPDHHKVSELNTDLLLSASIFDEENPNIITKLIPTHYFLEGQAESGFKTTQGEIYNKIEGDSIPGSAKLGSAQILTSFLLIYAKFFDELKIVIDSISNFLNLDYNDIDSSPDQLIPVLAKYYGIDIPSLFSHSNIFEFVDGENLGDVYGFSDRSLRDVQNTLWKRFLINVPYIFKSKGTISSVKSTIRSFGIDPDGLMNIREFGGPTTRDLSDLRQRRVKTISFLDYSGSINSSHSSLDYHGFSSNIPHLITPFLTSSRKSPGFPKIQGTFVDKTEQDRNGISNNAEDGLLIPGSWTYEGIYRFLNYTKAGYRQLTTQSLARFQITGSSVNKGAVITNLVAVSGGLSHEGDSQDTINLYVRSALSTGAPGFRLTLTGSSLKLFDGNFWYISCGRNRSDDIITSVSESYLAPKVSVEGSSSWFLRCGRISDGTLTDVFSKRHFFSDAGHTTAFENKSTTYNVSGACVVIGSQSLGDYTDLFLSDTSLGSVQGFGATDRNMASSTDFSGQVSKIRFWSKGLYDTTFKDHIRNPDSIGSINPDINYNYESQETGSFQRPRIDLQMSQPETSASLDSLSITNFTQELGDAICYGLESEAEAIKNEGIFYSILSPKFDLSQTDEKVRIRGYQRRELIDNSSYAHASPIYEVLKSESPDDDTRFAIEFSSVKALEEDIMSIFSSLEYFDNAIGKPSLLFDEIYPDIEQARKVYFRRLFAKPEFQNYFKMFKWFSNSLGFVIEQMIPKKTKFLGVDFIFESHPLERNRFRYLFDDIYLTSLERPFDRGDLFLSQYVISVTKF